MMGEDEMWVTMEQVRNTIEHMNIQLNIIKFIILTNENNWLGRHTRQSEIYHIHTVRQIISLQKQSGITASNRIVFLMVSNIISLVRQATPDKNKSKQSTHIANRKHN